MKEPILSIIVPVFNEEKNLIEVNRKIHEAFQSFQNYFEIIYVNDGSRDKSKFVLKKIEKKFVQNKTYNFYKNIGKTFALKFGFKKAKGKIILTIDSDQSFDPLDLLKLLHFIQFYDVAVGFRNDIDRIKADGWIKFISSKISNCLRNIILIENFRDAGCPLKVFKREVINEIPFWKGSEVFLLSLLKTHKASIKQIPVSVRARKYGFSKHGISNRLLDGIYGLFFVFYLKFLKV